MVKNNSGLDREDERLDVIFVHVPRFNNYYPPLNVHITCNRMAMGLLALTDLVNRNGYTSRLLHGGIEHRLNKKFSFETYLRKYRPGIIGFSQHFHHNLVDTLQWAATARKVLPDSFILLGGFTSTLFAEDIIRKAPYVDAVCKGDAEIPLLDLCKRVLGEKSHDLTDLPNFVWRSGIEVMSNSQSYTLTQDILDNLLFTNFKLLEHAETYIDMPKAPMLTNIPGNFDKMVNSLIGKDKGRFYWGLPVGRGCVYDCCYCGGGNKAQRKINKRAGIIARDQENVLTSIRELLDFGFKGGYISFDPTPTWSEKYYCELFRRIRSSNLQFDILFSSWRLPTELFFEEFSKTFGDNSAILISPETGSDEIRKVTRPNCFTNEELLERLEYGETLGVRTTIYFSIGALERSLSDIEQTLDLKKQIQDRFPNAIIEGFLVEAEPGAPWQVNPKKYGINLQRKNFDDFIHTHCSKEYSSMTHLGYTTCLFGDSDIDPEDFYKQLLRFRCKYFCDKRLQCTLMKGVWAFCRYLGLAPKPAMRSVDLSQ